MMLTVERSVFISAMLLVSYRGAQSAPPSPVVPAPPATEIEPSSRDGYRGNPPAITLDERINEVIRKKRMISLVELLRDARRIDKQGLELKKLAASINAQIFRLEAQRAPLGGVSRTLDLAAIKEKLKPIANAKDQQTKRTQLQDLLDTYKISSIDLQNALSLEPVEAQINDLGKLKDSVLSQIDEHVQRVDLAPAGGEETAQVFVDQTGIHNLRKKLESLTSESTSKDTRLPKLNHDLDFLNQFQGDQQK